jgi:site-specific DNA-cytosine methylase
MSPGHNRDGLFIPETTTALLASADNGYDMDGTGRGTPIIGFHPKQDPINGSIAPSMGAESGPMGVLIEAAVRRLSPTECERLQGFPDGWTAEGADGPQADSTRYRELGNAVAVPVANWVGQRLMYWIMAEENDTPC